MSASIIISIAVSVTGLTVCVWSVMKAYAVAKKTTEDKISKQKAHIEHPQGSHKQFVLSGNNA